MIRVLHLLKTSVGATWALRQMRELAALGVEVHAALPPGPLIPKYEAAGVHVHLLQPDLPMRAPGKWSGLFSQVRKLVSTVQPDLIHSHFVGTTLTMRMALGKGHAIPRLFQVPGPLHLEHPFFRRAELLTAGPRDHWIGSCRWTCDRYRRSGIPDDRIFLSYYGSDLNELACSISGKLRQELRLDAKTKVVGMVAYMYAPKRYLGQSRGLKGHEDLIDALAICRRKDPHILGVFIGGPWQNAARYEERVRAYGRERCGDGVVFLGTRRDVKDLYPDLDLVVHPSHSENVGGAAESLLMAVPTIATNVGGFPDVVIDGETGWLVPPRDPQRLADAIMRALADLAKCRSMAVKGQARARQLLDIKRNAREVLDAYTAVLAR
jgi:glycosyltransferase involved in cell wall biosynthesis